MLFEFYLKYYLIKDIQTKQILLKDETHKGLCRFYLSKVHHPSNTRNLCNLAEYGSPEIVNSAFDIWHNKLGHHGVKIVNKVLNDSKIEVSNVRASYVCTCCQMEKSHNLAFPESHLNMTSCCNLLQLFCADRHPVVQIMGSNIIFLLLMHILDTHGYSS